MIEAWNKADRLDPDAAAALALAAQGQDAVLVSALQGTGLDRLCEEIEHRLAAGAQLASVRLAPYQGEARAWLYAHAEVLGEESDEGGRARLSVRARPDVIGRFQARFPSVVIGPDDARDEGDDASGQDG
jgi:GTP-binding protein HflX